MDELTENEVPVKGQCENRVSAGGVLQSEAEKKKRAIRREKDAKAFGKLRNGDILKSALTVDELAYLGLRATYTGDFGLNAHKVRRDHVNGFCEARIKKARAGLREKGCLDRQQGRRKNGGRGRGYAKERLTRPQPCTGFVMFGREELYEGTLDTKEIVTTLVVRAKGQYGATPKQIGERLGVTRPTVNRILRGIKDKAGYVVKTGLIARGLVQNIGTDHKPLYIAETLKKPTRKSCKKPTFKKSTFKKPDDILRPLKPLSQSKIPILKITKSAARRVDLQQSERTDGASGSLSPGQHATLPAESRVGFSRGASGELPHFSADVLADLRARDVDVDALRKRYAKKTKGKVIENPDAYLLAMGEEEVGKRLGVPKEVLKNISSRNRAQRGTALGLAMGVSAELSRDVVDDVCRLAERYGLNAQEQIQLWRTQREGRPATNPDASLRSFFYSAVFQARENARRAQST